MVEPFSMFLSFLNKRILKREYYVMWLLWGNQPDFRVYILASAV